MDDNRMVDVGSLLSSAAQMLQRNKSGLNGIPNGGNHGDRMVEAFQAAAQAANQTQGDAGQQFAAAAQAMKQQGRGKSAQFYAQGLEQAAQQFKGQSGVSAADLGPLLQSLAGGAQQGNPMQPGQGGMLDALLPAAQGFMGAQSQGLDPAQAAIHALGGAVSGAHRTSRNGTVDPGAASATGVISGIIGALLPSVLGAVMSGALGGGGRQPQQGGGGLGGGLGGLLGGLLGGGSQQGAPDYSQYPQPHASDPLGGLGGLLGGFLGGGGGGGGQSPLGGLFGGGGGSGSSLQQPKPDSGDKTKYV